MTPQSRLKKRVDEPDPDDVTDARNPGVEPYGKYGWSDSALERERAERLSTSGHKPPPVAKRHADHYDIQSGDLKLVDFDSKEDAERVMAQQPGPMVSQSPGGGRTSESRKSPRWRQFVNRKR